MGMVFTHHLADGVGCFLMGLVRGIAHDIHSVQYAAMDGLESVAHIRKGTRNDNGHRIVDVGRFHFVLDVNLNNAVFVEHDIF